MSKWTRAKKWAEENPEAVFYGVACTTLVGVTLWVRHAVKNAQPFPVAYHFAPMDEHNMKIYRLMDNDTLQYRIFNINPNPAIPNV